MATRKNIAIAARFCRGGDELQSWLMGGRYSIAQIAGFLGTSPQVLNQLLAEPAPLAQLPLNWTSDPGPGVYAPWIGVVPIPYAGPSTPGYTYGPPEASREDFS
jgi:hypothetical protein